MTHAHPRRLGTAVAGLATVSLLFAAPARAQTPAMPQGVVNLSASASTEVVKDLLSITLSTTRDAPDAATVQSQLKQALDAALSEAKKAVRPGQLDLRTGSFSVSPRYTQKGVANGWHGSAELVVEGRDLQAIGQLTGRISSLTISRVGYDISPELRARVEGEVTARAIALYQTRAAECARQFGYTGYSIREVSLNSSDGAPVRPMAMAMAKMALVTSGDDSLPVEPGKATVTASVAGSVQMTR